MYILTPCVMSCFVFFSYNILVFGWKIPAFTKWPIYQHSSLWQLLVTIQFRLKLDIHQSSYHVYFYLCHFYCHIHASTIIVKTSWGDRMKETRLWITNLIGLVVDAVCQWVGPHANIEVGITEPLHCLLHVGDRPQSDLNPGERRARVTNIAGLCRHLVDTSGNWSLDTNGPVFFPSTLSYTSLQLHTTCFLKPCQLKQTYKLTQNHRQGFCVKIWLILIWPPFQPCVWSGSLAC